VVVYVHQLSQFTPEEDFNSQNITWFVITSGVENLLQKCKFCDPCQWQVDIKITCNSIPVYPMTLLSQLYNACITWSATSECCWKWFDWLLTGGGHNRF